MQWLLPLMIVGIEYLAYLGIMDNAANRTGSETSLVGGQALDWLGLALLIQWTSLYSTKMYWLMLVFPVGGGYSLYTTFAGGGGSGGTSKVASNNNEDDGNHEAATERRQKRAERRRRKWQ